LRQYEAGWTAVSGVGEGRTRHDGTGLNMAKYRTDEIRTMYHTSKTRSDT
jgi:hypothetical protein